MEEAVNPKFIALAKKLLRSRRPIICDIGSRDASEGIALLTALHGRTLHVFEPNPIAADRCRSNLARFTDGNNPGTVEFNELALADSGGTRKFYPVNPVLSENHDIGFSSMFRINPAYTKRRGSIVQDEITVDVSTLDDYFANKKLPDLLWIDVEGAELQVLQGAARVLQNVKLVHVEVSFRPMQVSKPLFWDISNHLTNCGFCFHGFIEISALTGFLYRHRLLPNPPWRLNAVFYRDSLPQTLA